MPRLLLFCLALSISLVSANGQHHPLTSSWDDFMKLKNETPFNLEWISIGPVMNSTRVGAVQADETHPGTWYVSFGTGGLWKTVDHGLTWKPIFEEQPAQGIGDFALAPSNPEVIYVGTGRSLKKPRNFTLPGVGVFRSDDAGNSWRYLGLPDSWHIGEIAVHPQNPDIVFVAVLGKFWSPDPNRGLYRSTNGGLTWEHVLQTDENTGANDVVIAPSDPDYVYVTTWEHYPGLSGANSTIYRSTDGGATFEKADRGFAKGPKTGRVGLAVSYQDPLKVYALVDNLNRDKNRGAEYYVTINGGDSWEKTHQEDLLIFPGIGWYFTDTYVNPQDDRLVYLLGVRAVRSQDGGKTFSMLAGDVYHLFPNEAIPLHLDHCEMWVNPLNPSNLLLGNDGGFYVTYDKGGSWMHYNNIPTGEFYDISVDSLDPYRVFGGTQDNSSVFGPAREYDPRFADGWEYIWVDAWAGGDGCVTLADPEDPTLIYTSSQHGNIFIMDLDARQSRGIRPGLPKGSKETLQYQFVTPYILSNHPPEKPGDRYRLYHAGNFVFRSDDRGENWSLISPDISRSSDPAKVGVAAGAIAESPLDRNRLFTGNDRGAFWITTDGGENWLERSAGLPNAYIRSIAASRHHPDRVYVALTGINYDDLGRHLYVTEDLGQSWRDLGGNLPDEVVNVVLEDPWFEEVIYAGTIRGVYLSVDRGTTWSLFGCGMPVIPVSDLDIQMRTRDLVAGTHGRGIYKLNLKPIHEWLQVAGWGLQPATPNLQPATCLLFSVPPLKAPRYNPTHRDPDPRTVEKTAITFWLSQNQEVTLRVMEGKKVLFQKDIYGYTGFNQFRWDGVVKETDSMAPYFIHYKEYIKPGKYRFEIEGERIEVSGKLIVL